jgi:hypothetical protein
VQCRKTQGGFGRRLITLKAVWKFQWASDQAGFRQDRSSSGFSAGDLRENTCVNRIGLASILGAAV